MMSPTVSSVFLAVFSAGARVTCWLSLNRDRISTAG